MDETIIMVDLTTSVLVKVQALSVVRTLGRNPVGSDPIFTKETMVTLIKLAGIQKSTEPVDTTVSREALKVIANSIYLNDECKTYLEEEEGINGCLGLLKLPSLSLEAQFLGCRILFFMTIGRQDLVSQLIKGDIASPIEKILSDNVHILQTKTIDRNSPINHWTVMSEALKLLFNLLLVDGRKEQKDTDQPDAPLALKTCLIPIYRMLFDVPFPEPQPLVPPHTQCFHALMQFPYDMSLEVWRSQKDWISQKYSTPEEGGHYVVGHIVDILDRALHALIPGGDPDQSNINHAQADAAVAPVLLVLANLIEGCPYVIPFLASKMLPRQEDRTLPVNEGDHLPAYLIRLMTSTMMPQSRSAICEILFMLCDKDGK
ncbi:guanine nucleotide exchange factor [Blakeslea trispora]|nr:guanine nucleotide exchange factor [Blakeslea trispora]